MTFFDTNSIFHYMLHLGIDVGSTTIKVVLLDEDKKILYSDYQRHLSLIKEKSAEMLEKVKPFTKDEKVTISISGSAGMGVATECNINFVQEVYATRVAAKEYEPDTDTIIELGGEDAKILFLTNGLEVRMNGTCAGGTGAFIDQMATLLGIGRDEVDYYSKKSKQIYTIASRCGVFAKSDIHPLINQGAKVEDIASSILLAVVNQTIAGLAQGRKIKGKVLYLGGPLTFLSRLRYFFDQELKLNGICPENSLYYVALGAALSPSATSCRARKNRDKPRERRPSHYAHRRRTATHTAQLQRSWKSACRRPNRHRQIPEPLPVDSRSPRTAVAQDLRPRHRCRRQSGSAVDRAHPRVFLRHPGRQSRDTRPRRHVQHRAICPHNVEQKFAPGSTLQMR